MLKDLKRCLGIAGLLTFGVVPLAAASQCPALLNHTFPGLQDGKPQSLCQYQGKAILVVNTASFCGFTSQYEGLEKLYARLKDKGLVVHRIPVQRFWRAGAGQRKGNCRFLPPDLWHRVSDAEPRLR